MYITLAEAKDQVSIEQANVLHDVRLTRLITAAEDWAANFLNDSLAAFEDSPANSPPTIPEAIKSALLLHLEFEFDRNDRNAAILLDRAEKLLWPYRVGLEI